MKTTLSIDDDLLLQAQELTGISDIVTLVHAALKSLIEREASWRLAQLGGTQPDIKPIPRRPTG
jgi:Arc/MetJ family transcription regulator